MKKITSILLILLAFASCKNENFKDYIEQGFSKPTVSDVHFSKSNIGDGNKLYVPSEKEIEVEFTIKNRYSKELQGTLELQEDKKALFNTLPYIKELTFTKMVIAFNFKKEGEPSNTNHFLGESVPITLKIYDKKTSHFLSSQNISANCNTAPLSIPSENIHYDQDEDEYVVRLPKNQEKHEDLKKVEFYLSDKGGNKSASPKIFSIVEETEQNVVHHLKIKGDENWQLGKPQGDRTLKAIVYDRAGLKSTEGEKVSKRIFATITLVPDHDDVDLSSIKNGLKAPKIKELVDYFQTREVWEASGYSVSFISDDFEYDSKEDKLREKTSGSIVAKNKPYKVKVQLTGGGNTLTAEYEITVVEDTVAGINTSKFSITDETEYNPPTYPKLNFPNVTFEDDGPNGKKASIEVPYTGFVTKLKVYVEALGSNGKIKENLSVVGSKTKTFDKILDANRGDPDGTKTLEFYAVASNGPATERYTIEFTRGESVKVELEFQNEQTLTGSKNIATGKVLWEAYNKEKTIEYNPDNASTNNKREITVRKGADVKFTISLPIEGVKVKECTSNIGHDTSSAIPNGCDGLVLNASEDFKLTVLLGPEASVKWKNHKTSNFGYGNGKISYTSPDGTNSNVNLNGKDLGRAVKNRTSAIFKLEGFKAETHFVEKWIVKHGDVTDEVTNNADNYELGENNSTLKIVEVKDEYEVEVIVKKFCKVVVEIGQYNGSNFETFTGHKYQITAKDNETPLNPDEATPINTYTFSKIKPNTTIKFVALAETDSVYEFIKWEYKKTSFTGGYSSTSGGSTKELEKKIEEDMDVRLILKKQEYKLTVRFRNVKTGYPHLYTLTATDITDSHAETQLQSKSSETDSDTYTYYITYN